MRLLLLASAPVIIILVYIYIRDRYEKEPVGMLLRSLFFGMLIILPVVAVETILGRYSGIFPGMTRTAYVAFIVAGFTEELFKFAALHLTIWRNKNFNERFDGIVYAVFISLGFAWIENIMYVFQHGFSTGMLRAFTAVPAHAIFGVSMGFYFSKAKFVNKAYLPMALIMPIVLHGVYDFILMSGKSFLLALFIPYMIFLFARAYKEMDQLSVN